MTPPCAVNYLVTRTWESIPWVHGPVACSKVRSTHNAETTATIDMGVASALPRFVETREQANRLAESAFPILPNKGNSHAPLSCRPKDAGDGTQLSDDTNRRQFHVALLENCSFFAHLVLRHVRAGGNPSSCFLGRDSSRKKLNVARVSQALARSSANTLPGQLPVEERSLQPEAPSSSLQTLWVEVGRRHAQTLVSEKERHEYRENSKPAL